MPVNKKGPGEDGEQFALIDARGVHYRELNRRINEQVQQGKRHIVVKGVRGQRYLGTGLDCPDLLLELHGVPGEDLGFNLNGPTIEVFGHGQNAIGNTMDSGTIAVHGMGGDALAYGMRGGRLMVRDDVGYRVGIHMKEYGKKVPQVVIGGTAGDYLGEYMAGGIVVLLNKDNLEVMVAGDSEKTLATGMHGGELYIYGYEVPSYLLGIGAELGAPRREDRQKVEALVREHCRFFGLDPALLLERELVKIAPQGSRPFARFYYPAYPSDTGLKPRHAERVSPCEVACPSGIPTGRFLRHLRHEEFARAVELIDEYTPLRNSCCGFICPHLCMESCSRGRVDFPVRTAELARRFKSEQDAAPSARWDEKIAVIGAGPAGLSAAYQLARRGYPVTVFDEAPRPGGKLYQVISRNRLPLEELERDLGRMEKMGIRFVNETRVDAERMEALLEDFDYVIVAAGAHRPVMPPVKGVEHLRAGLDFLKEVNRARVEGSPSAASLGVGEKIVVIGGGDAAIDGIEAALELGVDPAGITVIDIQKPSANPDERRKLEKMGVRFRYPVFLQEAVPGGLRVQDSMGREEFLPADTAVVFINEMPELDFLPSLLRESRDKRGFYSLDEKSFRTAHPRISVTGDAAGLGLVTTNIGRGRRCALEVDAKLRGREYLPEPDVEPEVIPAHRLRAVPLEEGETDIEEECLRCLHCGICVQCDRCVESCPRGALERHGEEFEVDLRKCGGCGTCAANCPGNVIQMVSR